MLSLDSRTPWGAIALLAVAGYCCQASATQPATETDEWPWWRGPARNGWAPADANPPTQFGKTSDTSLAWKTPIPGRGHSSPVVSKGRIFLATADEHSQTHLIVCLDFQSGQQLWQKAVSTGGFPRENHAKNTEASPTIASDGERIFISLFHHLKVELFAFSHDGELAWKKTVCDFNPKKYKYGYAASPTIYQSLVIVAAEYDGPSYLVAYDRVTGREAWRTPRKNAITFSTPVVANVAGRDQLLISGGSTVSSYDPSTGRPLWQTPGTTSATCGTMVWQGSIAVASGGYPKRETIAIAADGSRRVLWKNDLKCYEQSMIVVNGYVYGLTDRGILYCWELNSGREMWRQRLSGPVSASPVFAGGHVYWSTERGSMYVFKPSPKRYQPVAENRVGDSAFASPAVVGNCILLRVGERESGRLQEYLYCFEN